MRFAITIEGTPVSARIDSVQGLQGIYGRNSTAQFTLVGGDDSASLGDEVIISDADTGTKVYRGYIAQITTEARNRTLKVITYQCTGLESRLKSTIVNASYVGQTDRAILQSAFSAQAEIATTNATVAIVGTAIDFTAKDLTLFDICEQLSAITGAEWKITLDKALSWRAAGSVLAPIEFDTRA